MAIRVAINGFGRIGRAVARNLFQRPEFKLVAINDIMDAKMMAYLLHYDSVHGDLAKKMRLEDEKLIVEDHEISLSHSPEPGNMRCEADIVIESTGRFLSKNLAAPHLKNAKKVILSAPAIDDTPTFVYGVNHTEYNGESIISNASCTTNCLAPIAKLIDERFKIQKGLMTTIHSYTIDQNLLDSDHKRDIRRSRAAALNILPTSTGAAKAIDRVLPSLKNKLHGRSVRVPVADVSLMDLDLVVASSCSTDEINELFKEASQNGMKGVLGLDEDFRVSQDFLNSPLSSIVAADLTQVIGGNMLKVMSWYDNEWGYANRLLDMASFIHHQKKE